jgi:hypothetical protein
LKNCREEKGSIIYRQALQKHKLKGLFPQAYDSALSEMRILAKVGIFPVYNSGNWKFTKDIV